MEGLGKKRKGVDMSPKSENDLSQLISIWSHLSLEDISVRKKKFKEVMVREAVASSKSLGTGVIATPPHGRPQGDPQGRGLKRKIGCIDVATRIGRRKKIDHEYELGDIIGQGKFGSVILCRSKVNGEQFACKTLPKGEEIVHREVEIMQHLSGHPGVVMLKAVYEDSDSFHLVMELCSGGRLLDQMGRVERHSEQQAASLIKELMLVIRYCHEMGVVHRDIKPENILLTTSGRIKLADFGLAVRISDRQSITGIVGSPAYVAPEVLVGAYSEKVDIWSAGVLLHALLVGIFPFQGDSLETVFNAIKQENIDFRAGVWESVSHQARDLLSCMLRRDVSTRFTASEVLSHPWILFYTEPILRSPVLKSKTKAHVRMTMSESSNLDVGCFINHGSKTDPYSGYSSNSLEVEDSGLVDILAVAISHVRISEPKRSRLCYPSTSSQQELPSNVSSNHLCTAF